MKFSTLTETQSLNNQQLAPHMLKEEDLISVVNVGEQLNPYSSHEGNHWIWLPDVLSLTHHLTFFSAEARIVHIVGIIRARTHPLTLIGSWKRILQLSLETQLLGVQWWKKWSSIWQIQAFQGHLLFAARLRLSKRAERQVTHLFIKLPNQSTSTSEALGTPHWHWLQTQEPQRSKFVVCPRFFQLC